MRQGELMKSQHGDSWFKEFAIKTQAYEKITDSNEKTIFTDNIYEAILSTGMLYITVIELKANLSSMISRAIMLKILTIIRELLKRRKTC